MSYIGNKPTQGAITGGNIVDGSIESIDLATLTNIDINSGSIDGTVIGASSAAAGTFSGLTVRNDTSNSGRMRVSSSATTAGEYRGYEFGNGSVFKGGLLQDQSTDMISLFTPIGGQSVNVTSSGNVGIGTNNPIRKLHIYESGTGNVGIEIDNPQTGEACTIGKQGNTAYGATSVGDTHLYTYDSNITIMSDGGAGNTSSIKFATGGNTERARIDSSGNFRVGNTSTEISSVGGRMLADGRVIGVTNNSACFTARRFGSDGDLISLFNKNGAVVGGVGTYGSTTFIQSDSAANHVGLLFNGSQVEPCRNDGSSGGEPRADSSVDLGSSGYRFKDLYLSGTIRSVSIYNNTSSGNANLGISAGGEVYRSTSSIKYKEDVQDAQHGLTELLSLRPVTYRGINDGDTVFGGLIAEEVHDAGLTEFVEYNEDNEPDALAYANMVSLCIKAIQDQQEIIDSLKTRIETLENTGA